MPLGFEGSEACGEAYDRVVTCVAALVDLAKGGEGAADGELIKPGSDAEEAERAIKGGRAGRDGLELQGGGADRGRIQIAHDFERGCHTCLLGLAAGPLRQRGVTDEAHARNGKSGTPV